MSKLEVGMYIKLNGFITKIHHINTSKKGETYIQFLQPNKINASMNVRWYSGISSYNIIDLIEVGDYVNGYKVSDIRKDIMYCCEDEFEDYCIKIDKKDLDKYKQKFIDSFDKIL